MKKAIIFFQILAVLAILISIPLLFSGITGTVRSQRVSKDYLSTQAFVSDYQEVRGRGSKSHKTYYYLTYAYTVEGNLYYIADDLRVPNLPPEGYSREVLYDPVSPENAVFTGNSASALSIFVGLLFLLIPLMMLFSWFIAVRRLPAQKDQPL